MDKETARKHIISSLKDDDYSEGQLARIIDILNE